MKAVNDLKKLMQMFIDQKISAEEFADQFEGDFFDQEEEIYSHSLDLHNALSNVRDAIAYFQPDPKIREGVEYLLDENQLRETVKTNLEKLVG